METESTVTIRLVSAKAICAAAYWNEMLEGLGDPESSEAVTNSGKWAGYLE